MIGGKGDGEVFPRRGRWMPLFVAPTFCVLLGLGVWQLDRLSWKNELLADIQARLSDSAVTLSNLNAGTAVTSWNYRRVTATGKLLHEQSVILLARTYKAQAGGHILTPLVLDEQRAILVSRGWVPQGYELPKFSDEYSVTIEGIIRTPQNQGWFTPDNNPAVGQWYWVDLLALSVETGVTLLPVIIEAGLGPDPSALPIGGQTHVDLPNDHLQYALTWFGLAMVLLVSFVVYYRQSLSARRGKPGW